MAGQVKQYPFDLRLGNYNLDDVWTVMGKFIKRTYAFSISPQFS